jgi:hypothetical protein
VQYCLAKKNVAQYCLAMKNVVQYCRVQTPHMSLQ